MKREDLNHTVVSGNKWRKLKYNLQEAKRLGHDTLLSFGGAFSNHIYALAGVGQEFGFKTIGVIRGEEHLPLNSTLSFAQQCGMRIHYLDRTVYRQKAQPEILDFLKDLFGDYYLIPEGGTNQLAVRGCAEIIDEIEIDYDILCCPVGTGGTITGLISGLAGNCHALGFSALKGDFLNAEVRELLKTGENNFSNWTINTDYHFGGYAKIKLELVDFILAFEKTHSLPIEPIYTAKMFYGIFDLIKKDYFQKGTTIVAIHTGGLQGNNGFEFRKSL